MMTTKQIAEIRTIIRQKAKREESKRNLMKLSLKHVNSGLIIGDGVSESIS